MAHLTEISKYGDSEALKSFEESFAKSNPDRLFIYESTANGMNHWKDMCDRARSDIYQCRFTFLGWWANPHNSISKKDPRYKDYSYGKTGEEAELIQQVYDLYDHKITSEQLAWIRYESDHSDSGPGGIFSQNNPWTEQQAFIISGHSFFPVRLLTTEIKNMDLPENDELYGYQAYYYTFGERFFDLKMHFLDPNDSDANDKIELKVWEEPKEDGRYVIGCDPAWGRDENSDNSCIEVWRCYADKLVQVAEYATNDVDPPRCAWVLAHLAAAYRDSLVNVEITGGSGAVIMMEWKNIRTQLNAEMYEKRVRDMGWEDALSNARWYMYARVDSMGERPSVFNFQTTWQTKPQIMEQFKGEYYSKALVLKSKKLVNEMLNVIRDGSQIGAPSSKSEDGKDDRVFSSALAIRTWIEHRRPEMISLGLTYEKEQNRELGNETLSAKTINGIVARFLKSQAEKDDPELQRIPTWRNQMNL